jgi:hypothetical protein
MLLQQNSKQYALYFKRFPFKFTNANKSSFPKMLPLLVLLAVIPSVLAPNPRALEFSNNITFAGNTCFDCDNADSDWQNCEYPGIICYLFLLRELEKKFFVFFSKLLQFAFMNFSQLKFKKGFPKFINSNYS